MRIGFVWGILCGSVAVAALAWVAFVPTEQPAPTPLTQDLADAAGPDETPAMEPDIAALSPGSGEATPAAGAQPEPSAPLDAALDDPAPAVQPEVATDAETTAGRTDADAPAGGVSAALDSAETGDAGDSQADAEATPPAGDDMAGSAEGGAGEAAAPDTNAFAEDAPGTGSGKPAEDVIAALPQATQVETGRAGAGAPQAATGSADDGEEQAAEAEPAGTPAPSFDIVRVDADGQAVIAGRAGSGQLVEILLDGKVVESVEADSSGNFVAVIAVELGAEAHQLQLRVSAPDSALASSDDTGRPRAEADEATQSVDASPDHEPTPGALATLSGPGAMPAVDSTAVTAMDDAKESGSLARMKVPAPRPEELVGGLPSASQLRIAEKTGAPESQPAMNFAGKTGSEAGSPMSGPDAMPPATVGSATGGPAGADGMVATADRQSGAGGGSDPVGEAADEAHGRREATATGESDPAPQSGQTSAEGTGTGHASPADTAGAEPDPRYVFSAPVLILPSPGAEGAPALVEPRADTLALLQPGGDARHEGAIVLDQITYDPAGDVLVRGRAGNGHAVRVYGDGRLMETLPVRSGEWLLALPRDRVAHLSLLRFDEIGPAGEVVSRIEAPFRYTGERDQVLRDRQVVIQRGDNLWRIAEEVYGEGMRYSVIYGANSDLIRDPDLIYPDQVFTIPELVEAD